VTDRDYGHDADGYASSVAWLAAKTRLRRKDAEAAVRQMRLLDAATAAGGLTLSWAREIAGWTGRIDHEDLQAQADRVLAEAAAAVAAVIEALGKTRGPDDLRTAGQRYHDARKEGWGLARASCWVCPLGAEASGSWLP
jgi:hypothetical protein